MHRPLANHRRLLVLVAALCLACGCRERDQLEKEAPVLAHANLMVDRIAIGGVVSTVPNLPDSAENRDEWSAMFGGQLGRGRFGTLPIVPSRDVLPLLGRVEYDRMLDRFKSLGVCDSAALGQLQIALEGKARFVVFGKIEEDRTDWGQTEEETENKETKTTTKTRTLTTTRTVLVRLRFYDLSTGQMAWDHLTGGQLVESKSHDMSDFVPHDKKESFIGGMVKSIVNSAIKPDPDYPSPPTFRRCLATAFDNVGEYLKVEKKK